MERAQALSTGQCYVCRALRIDGRGFEGGGWVEALQEFFSIGLSEMLNLDHPYPPNLALHQ